MYTFKFRRASQAEWLSINPVLSSGEPGVEIDTGKFKIGNGVKTWTELDYFTPSESDSFLVEHINSLTPHPVYDDGPSLFLLYENAKV